MVPKDLTGFSVEQLRGFATAVRLELAAIKVARADGSFTVEQLPTFEALVDDQDRLYDAIQAAVDGAEADAAAEEAVTEAVAGDTEEKPEEEVAPVVDAEAVVDEAVASAAMGGGQGPRVTREEAKNANGDMRRFVRNMINGNCSSEERHSFSTMRRETNHIVREGGDASDAIVAARKDRLAGTDKTAAGCFCGPDDAINTIKQSGETVRPFSDTLPTITASGDVRYVREIATADALAGVTEWTCADQDSVDPDDSATWKPCFELDCSPEQTSAMYAVSACASFSTQQLIGNPALIANLEHVMGVAFSKTAELLVYNRTLALASQYDFTGYPTSGYGASAELLSAVGWAIELIKANLRETNPRYTLALPAGLLTRVLTDGVIRGFNEYRDESDLLDRLNTLGVANVVELADEVTGVPAPLAHPVPVAPGGPIVAAPAQPLIQQLLLYRPEDFVLGVGPNIDLGATRSPELARQNKLQWFTEGFEFVEKVGTAPTIAIQAPFCASGVRPALGEGIDCS